MNAAALAALIQKTRADAIEECAGIADRRARACALTIALIRAGRLWRNNPNARASENCARLEAVHIASLIRKLADSSTLVPDATQARDHMAEQMAWQPGDTGADVAGGSHGA